jgi:hypothetical protein
MVGAFDYIVGDERQMRIRLSPAAYPSLYPYSGFIIIQIVQSMSKLLCTI